MYLESTNILISNKFMAKTMKLILNLTKRKICHKANKTVPYSNISRKVRRNSLNLNRKTVFNIKIPSFSIKKTRILYLLVQKIPQPI